MCPSDSKAYAEAADCVLQNGELVAQFKATVLLMANGSDRVTSAPLQKLETDNKVMPGCLQFFRPVADWSPASHTWWLGIDGLLCDHTSLIYRHGPQQMLGLGDDSGVQRMRTMAVNTLLLVVGEVWQVSCWRSA